MLPEHGYVRVHYKERLHDPDGDDQANLWHPIKRDAKGEKVTDPKGLLFMSEGLEIDLSRAATPEKWKHGDLSEAEGLNKHDVWKKSRVLGDIINHTMLPFPPEQQDQWRAMHQFHQLYNVSDKVPDLPISIRAGRTRCMVVLALSRGVVVRCLLRVALR